MKITYKSISAKRQERRDRMQLFGAALGIVLGFMETLNIYTGISLIIPILGFALALVNVLIAKFYSTFQKKYGEKLELILFKINGFMMLITGLGFQFSGSKYVKYVYYILSLFFFIVLPYFLIPAKKKKFVLQLTDSEIIVNRFIFKAINYPWQEIETVFLNNEFLQLKTKQGKKSRKYFLQNNTKVLVTEIIDFMKKVKLENDFAFEIQET